MIYTQRTLKIPNQITFIGLVSSKKLLQTTGGNREGWTGKPSGNRGCHYGLNRALHFTTDEELMMDTPSIAPLMTNFGSITAKPIAVRNVLKMYDK